MINAKYAKTYSALIITMICCTMFEGISLLMIPRGKDVLEDIKGMNNAIKNDKNNEISGLYFLIIPILTSPS